MADHPYAQCPLDPDVMLRLETQMNLARVIEIEEHVSTGVCIHPQLKNLFLHGPFDGSTPLLLACQEGHLDAVKHIIENWGASFQTSARYYHHPSYKNWASKQIEGATPLFVASTNGHLNVVRYLVEMGADISSKTTSAKWEYGNMSPLYGALIEIDNITYLSKFLKKIPEFQARTAIVQFLLDSGADASTLPTSEIAPWMTHLANSSTTAIVAMINSGMCLEQLHPWYQSTILHHWASNPLGPLPESRTEEESPMAVVKLLVEMGANVNALDCDGLSPILRAAHEFEPNRSREYSRECFSILEYLLQRDEINREDKIKALELVGAVIISESENDHLFPEAFDCWRRALQLREMEVLGSGPLLKTVMQRKAGLPTEWINREQLEHVIQHPSEYPIQGLLVRLRVYSSISWNTVFDCFICPISDHRIEWLLQLREFSQVINYLWAILEMISNFQPQESVSGVFPAQFVGKIVQTFSKLRPTDQIMNSETIATTLSIILSTEPFHNDPWDWNVYLKTLLNLISILAAYPKLLNAENKRLLALLVQRSEKPIGWPPNEARTLLIMGSIEGFTNLATLRLLFESGVDPNAADIDGNGPLHHLLKNGNEGFQSGDVGCCCCLRMLLNSGADLNRVNNAGQTPKDLCLERDIDHLLGQPRKLKCLSSIVINAQGIPYSEETLPFTLHKCVELH